MKLQRASLFLALLAALAAGAFAWREARRGDRHRATAQQVSRQLEDARARLVATEGRAGEAERRAEEAGRRRDAAAAAAAGLEQKRAVAEARADAAEARSAALARLGDVVAGAIAGRAAFLDGVDLYQKNGLVETYGGRLDQRRAGPVSLRSTVLEPDGPEAWLIWSPDVTAPALARRLRIELDAHLDQGRLAVGLLTREGRLARWEIALGPEAPRPAAPPGDFDVARRAALIAGEPLALVREDGALIGDIPDDIAAALREGRVRSWFLSVSGASPAQAVAIRSIAALAGPPAPRASRTRIEGRVEGGSGGVVELVSESGERWRAGLTADGGFRFDDAPADRPLSLRLNVAGRDRYADRGRWFEARESVTRATIRVAPQFANPQGKPIDPQGARLAGPDKPLAFARYKPQALIRWPGTPGVQTFYREVEPLRRESAPPMQEFFGETFTNSIGFVDRERFAGNRDGCLRIAHAGGSSSVGIQVRPFEKFNALLEQELGVRLGRCVEVISAGRDNGDPGAVYPAVRDYLAPLAPDLLIVEHMQLLGLQMQPELLRRLLGWSFDYSPLPHFLVRDGVATFAPSDDSWPLSVSKPDRSPMKPGVPFLQTLSLPTADLPPEAVEAWRALEAVLRAYRTLMGATPVALQTGADQARCHLARSCGPRLVWPDGTSITGGVGVFMEHVARACEAAGTICLQPPVYAHAPGLEDLTYRDDGHYTLRGHQWLANHLADQLEPLLRARLATGKR